MGAKFTSATRFDIPKAAKNLASIELFAPAGALAEKLIIVKPQQATDLPLFLQPPAFFLTS